MPVRSTMVSVKEKRKRDMRVVKRSIFVVLASAGLVAGQASGQSVSPAPNKLEFFRYVFMSAGNPNATPTESQRRVDNFIAHWKLNATQGKIFASLCQEFRANMVPIRTAAQPLITRGPRGDLSDADRKTLKDLADKRDQIVLQLADRLIQSLGSDAAKIQRIWEGAPVVPAANIKP